MKLLYGSQNFGYDLPGSDEDWLEFAYPIWGQVIKGDVISKEKHNEDGSVTKVRDIRLIPKMINKANFNDLQFLFAKKKFDCEELNWFFKYRQELIRMDMWQLYNSNRGYIISQLKENSVKSVTRAYAFTFYLIGALGSKELQIYSEYFRQLRAELNDTNKSLLADSIRAKVERLGESYEKYKDHKDERLQRRMYWETELILKDKLNGM